MHSLQSMTGPIKIKHANGINVLDRKLCVAPMMDWTDKVDLSCEVNPLGTARSYRSFSVAVRFES